VDHDLSSNTLRGSNAAIIYHGRSTVLNVLQFLQVLRAPGIGGHRKLFCRKAMLPFGSHQAPMYRGSRQNRPNLFARKMLVPHVVARCQDRCPDTGHIRNRSPP